MWIYLDSEKHNIDISKFFGNFFPKVLWPLLRRKPKYYLEEKKYDIEKIKIIIIKFFKNDKSILNRVTPEMEDYFKEIGLVEEFLQLKKNYNLIEDYHKTIE